MQRFTAILRTFLLALVLGVSVWVSAVVGADPDEVDVYPDTIPLEVVGNDPSLIITSDIPSEVEVTLRAPKSVWDQLTARENSVQATLDLSGLGPGEHTVDVQIRVLERPYQIVLADPRSVTVTLEPLATQTFSIDPSLSGLPAIGYQAGAVDIEPTEVIITGPESLVNRAVRARVLISLDGIRESLDASISIQIMDEDNSVVQGLTITPERARVTVPVSQQGGFRDVAVKVVVTGQIAAGYRLENISVFPPVVTIFASDPELVTDLPGIIETQPLDLQDANEDITTRLSLILPEEVTLVGAQTVEVNVVISPIQTSLTLLNQPIDVIGLTEGLSIQTFPQTVDVIISGPLPTLDALTPQDVIVSVDVTDLGLGTYQLTPKVDVLVDNVLVESILPGTIEVIVSPPVTPTITPFPT
ncbi:MAG TPA: CdaR family protein, partial [Anaerolineales bacterium]|nr:CdaR family protein [Anaerolineales bacterium]